MILHLNMSVIRLYLTDLATQPIVLGNICTSDYGDLEMQYTVHIAIPICSRRLVITRGE